MVKNPSWIKLFLVLVMVMVSVVTMAPTYSPQMESQEFNDSSKRNARSANPLPISVGSAKKINLVINGRFLQIFRDGTVNGTEDENSDYSILQRTSVSPGQIRIEGIATCSFLCMNSCGLPYSADEFSDECIFNETMEPNHYNSYTSVKYSNENYTLYVALRANGKPRRARVKTGAGAGKLAASTNALPTEVPAERLEQLEQHKRELYTNHQHHELRHHQLCPPPHGARPTETLRCPSHKPPGRNKQRERLSHASAGAGDHEGGAQAHAHAHAHSTKEGATAAAAAGHHSAGGHRAKGSKNKEHEDGVSESKGRKSKKKKTSPSSRHPTEVSSGRTVPQQSGSSEEVGDNSKATTSADDGADD